MEFDHFKNNQKKNNKKPKPELRWKAPLLMLQYDFVSDSKLMTL